MKSLLLQRLFINTHIYHMTANIASYEQVYRHNNDCNWQDLIFMQQEVEKIFQYIVHHS